MTEGKDRVKESEENRQNIIEKLNVKSSEAKTYKGLMRKKKKSAIKKSDSESRLLNDQASFNGVSRK